MNKIAAVALLALSLCGALACGGPSASEAFDEEIAIPAPEPVPAPAPAPAKTCFYYCTTGGVPPDDYTYWTYSQFSDCTANRCDLNGQSSAGTGCTIPSNLLGTCT